ncbi:hypothetical protein RN001_011229 [Aquatica leii]|uniref:Uncharacterized protein n=1 Tax=Aquatica leii TaxID=1421715 RepID=A0AAN7P8W2_9COLE|nr:hypothetical protein RN001_011229 [Aquatica leii]
MRLVLMLLLLVSTNLARITIPGEKVDKKTLTSLGIKTLDWQQENDQQTLVNQVEDGFDQVQQFTDVKNNNRAYQKSGYEMRHDLQQIIAAEQHNLEDFDHYVPSSSDIVEQPGLPEGFYQCPKDLTGQFPYALSCNQFWNCWKGRGVLQNCAPGTLFNPYTFECDYASKVKCYYGPKAESYTQESLANLQLKTGCPTGFSGVVPHHHDCSKFINCNHGQEIVMDCAPGTLFNLKINSCDYPYNTECASWSSEFGDDDQTQEGSSHHVLVEAARVDKKRPILCPPDVVGLLPHPSDCSKFLNCASGQTFIQDCGPGTYFNPDSKVCDFPYNVDCKNGDSAIDVRGPPDTLQCPLHARGVYPHPQFCFKYVNCGQGRTDIKECPSGMMYDVDSNGCDHASNVDCSRKNVKSIWDQGNFDYSTSQSQHSQNWHQGGGNQHQGQWNQQAQGTWNQGNVNREQQSNTGSNQGSATNTEWNQEHVDQGWNQQGQDSRWTQQNVNQGWNQQKPNQNTGTNANQGWNQHGSNTWDQQNTNQGWNQQKPSQGTGSGNWNQANTNSGWNQQGQYGKDNWDQENVDHSWNQQKPNQNTNSNQGQHGDTSWNQQGTTTWDPQYVNKPTTNQNTGTNQGQHSGGTWNQGNTNIGWNQQGQTHGGTTWDKQNTNQQKPNQNTGTDQGQHSGSTWNQQNVNKGWNQENTNKGWNQQGQSQGGTTWDQQNANQGLNQQKPNQNTGIDQGQYIGSTWEQQNVNKGWNQPTTNQNTGTNQGTWYQENTNKGWNQQGQSQGGTTWDQQNANQGLNQQKPNQNTGINQGQQSGSNWNQQGGTPWNQQNVNKGWNQPTTSQNAGTNQGTWNQENTNKGWNQPSSTSWNQIQIKNEATTLPNKPSSTVWSQNQNQLTWHDGKLNQNIDQTESESQIVENTWNPNTSKQPVKGQKDVKPNANIKVKDVCSMKDFYCTPNTCVPRSMRCDGVKDCPNGIDERNCDKILNEFILTSNHILAIREKEKFFNVSVMSCAKACLEIESFQCRSFSFRRDDGACFISDANVGVSGSLILSYPYDYYEFSALSMNCTNLHKCPNHKCISYKQICDGVNDCGDRTDEKGCSAQAFGYAIALAGGGDKHEGRIEIEAFGKSGYVCDDKFGLRDAEIVCKELGYPLGALEVKGNSFYAQDLKDQKILYLMDDVTCLGNETSIRDCDFNGWGVSNCEPQEIVGVVCKTPQETCPKDHWKCDTVPECLPLAFVCDGVYDCTDQSDEGSQHCDAPIELRLVGGSNKREGRVEIRHYGIWGTVCDDDFNDDAAKVVCKYLGYPGKAAAKKNGGFGPGTGPIWLDQVYCQGNESALQHCVHWNWGEHNCEHTEDVGVICSGTETPVVESERSAHFENIPEKVFEEQCGMRKDAIFLTDDEVHFRVVGGAIAKKGDYPWQASLRIKNQGSTTHWCGAVVITKKFILTAAHCLQGFSKGAYMVVAGDYNTDEDEGTEQEAYIEEFYIHERFRVGQKMNNDIALIKLKGAGFTFTKDVQPICLPDTDVRYLTGANCTISGFGSIQSGKSSYSHDMRAAYIPLIAQDVCKMPHVYGDTITDGMVCAGSLDEGADACEGDSGGPLACLYDGYFTLFGLTSWGHHCGHANKPGVYVRVAHYRKWIDDMIFRHI